MGKRILVVEDNRIAAEVAKILFERLGCEVDHVTDGGDAITQVLKKNYDGICMDIGLPTLSGLEACKAIRKHETEHHLIPIPILTVTGNNSEEETKTYLEAGMQAVIIKPLTQEKAEHFLSLCLCK